MADGLWWFRGVTSCSSPELIPVSHNLLCQWILNALLALRSCQNHDCQQSAVSSSLWIHTYPYHKQGALLIADPMIPKYGCGSKPCSPGVPSWTSLSILSIVFLPIVVGYYPPPNWWSITIVGYCPPIIVAIVGSQPLYSLSFTIDH